MNPLNLRDQWGYSETSKNGSIRLCASVSWETKTAHKISSRNNTLGETKLIFLVYEQDSEKIGSVGRQNKNDVIWFLGSVLF